MFHLEIALTSVFDHCKIVAGILLAIRENLLRDDVITFNQVDTVFKHTPRKGLIRGVSVGLHSHLSHFPRKPSQILSRL